MTSYCLHCNAKFSSCDYLEVHKHKYCLVMKRHADEDDRLPVSNEKRQRSLKYEEHPNLFDKVLYTCNVCSKNFTTAHYLRSHMLMHTNKRFKCDLCDYSDLRKSKVVEHTRLKHPTKQYKCKFFPKVFKSYLELNDHLTEHVKRKCNFCELEFFDREKFRFHMTKEHSLRKCDVCRLEFNHREKFLSHMATHTEKNDNKGYVCSICGVKLKTLRIYRMHSLNHKNSVLVASFPKSLADKITEFVKPKSIEPEFEKSGTQFCYICNETFSKGSFLFLHYYYHHKHTYECFMCGDCFATKDDLHKIVSN